MTPDRDPVSDPQTQQQGAVHGAPHVPEPASGVRGADAVDGFDTSPGHGTTTGADGETAAREQLRKDLGERAPQLGEESDGQLDQTAALGATDDPEGGSVQRDGSAGA